MNGTYTQRRRTQMAGGGITNARQGYFLGDLVRKIKDDIIKPNYIGKKFGNKKFMGRNKYKKKYNFQSNKRKNYFYSKKNTDHKFS